ncbi:hypothetical protein KJB29_01370 [Geobacter grbiciae]|nr:hypothetical protein [Geobacter grbiciae]
MKAWQMHPGPAMFNKIIAVLLIMAVLTIAGNGLCFAQDNDHCPQASCAKAGSVLKADCADASPCCPDDGGDTEGDCHCCLSCPCHAPLNSHPPLISYSPLIISLSFLEHLNAPPDVYRSIFVPPQIQA